MISLYCTMCALSSEKAHIVHKSHIAQKLSCGFMQIWVTHYCPVTAMLQGVFCTILYIVQGEEDYHVQLL